MTHQKLTRMGTREGILLRVAQKGYRQAVLAKFKIDDMFDMLKAGLGTHPKLALADLPLPKKRWQTTQS